MDFTVVHNLAHNLVLGWDFMSRSNMILNCSTEQSVKLKVRVKRPVSIPPRTAVCLSIKVDQRLSTEDEYLFLGQRSNDFEAADALIRPFSEFEMPLYARNRSDRVITIHRRSVIEFIERVEHVELRLILFPLMTVGFSARALKTCSASLLSGSRSRLYSVTSWRRCCALFQKSFRGDTRISDPALMSSFTLSVAGKWPHHWI